MSDEQLRDELRRLGPDAMNGDLEAARRMVWIIERHHDPKPKLVSPWSEGPLKWTRDGSDSETVKLGRFVALKRLPRDVGGDYYLDNLAALFVTCHAVPELIALNSGDWFGEWPMALCAAGADPERSNTTPRRMTDWIRREIDGARSGGT